LSALSALFFATLAASTLTLFSGCGAAPIKPEKTVTGELGSAKGQWRGKALMRNLQNGKTGTLNIDVVAEEPSHLRLEITGPMSVYVASFALSGNEVRYILAQQKKFVVAPADSDALRELVPIRIAPTELLKVLFDRPLPSATWKCETDPAGVLSMCLHKGGTVKLTWLERKGGYRKFKMESPTGEATLALEESKSKVEQKADVFDLQPPRSFKQENHMPTEATVPAGK
jgi:hypothetical protein